MGIDLIGVDFAGVDLVRIDLVGDFLSRALSGSSSPPRQIF